MGKNDKCILYTAKEYDDAVIPTRNHDTDAGFDVYCYEDIVISAGGYARIPTGVRIMCGEGYWWTTKSRSSLGYMKQLEVYGGVMDSNFTGDTTILVYNRSDKEHKFTKGDKFAQVVVLPLPDITVREVSLQDIEDLGKHSRGGKGFGSSGR